MGVKFGVDVVEFGVCDVDGVFGGVKVCCMFVV